MSPQLCGSVKPLSVLHIPQTRSYFPDYGIKICKSPSASFSWYHKQTSPAYQQEKILSFNVTHPQQGTHPVLPRISLLLQVIHGITHKPHGLTNSIQFCFSTLHTPQTRDTPDSAYLLLLGFQDITHRPHGLSNRIKLSFNVTHSPNKGHTRFYVSPASNFSRYHTQTSWANQQDKILS